MRTRAFWGIGLAAIFLALAAMPVCAHEAAPPPQVDEGHAEHGKLAEVGAKLANPVSNVWAMFTQFSLTFSDGDLNDGDPEFGSNMIFQPILPLPLYGEGADQWKLIVRPSVPILFGSPVPQGQDDFEHQVGLGDTLLPLLVAPPPSLTGSNWLVGLGPAFTFPTSTQDAFGRQQWQAGPAGLLGYKTKDLVAGVFPQYFFGIGSRGNSQGDDPDASNMSMLYFFFYNLPDAWQIGFNPNITFDSRAGSGDKWNVPVGLLVAKTTAIWGRPWKFQLGAEYSVISQDTFGQRFLIKFNVIPVIQPLIKSALFGG